MFGLLNINKPSGITSRAVVNKVERLVRPFKVGHSGTLDPIATGVLVLGVGSATRLLEYVQQMAKTYCATFLLGQSSVTEDIEGQVTVVDNAPIPSQTAVSQCLQQFKGTILQRPPQYSAIKIQGRRAYDIARSGKHVELDSREVTIHSIKLVQYNYPELELEVECSKGTYIRSIGRDLAEKLGTSAVMSALCRTAVGKFTITKSTSLSILQEELIPDNLLPPHLGVAHLYHLDLSRDQAQAVSHGRKISMKRCQTSSSHTDQVAAFCDSNLVAILRREGPFEWIPHKVFLPTNFTMDVSGKL